MNVKDRASLEICHSQPGPGADAGRPGRVTRLSAHPHDRRSYLRWPVHWQASLSDQRQDANCLVLDFSPAGAKVRTERPLALEPMFGLGFSGAIGLVGRLVWQRGCLLGIEFCYENRQCAELMEDSLMERSMAS